MPTVLLGNNAPRDLRTGELASLGMETVTVFQVPEEDPHDHRMRNITHQDGLWPQVSGGSPTWVACDDPALQEALARHFNCPAKPMGEAGDALTAAMGKVTEND